MTIVVGRFEAAPPPEPPPPPTTVPTHHDHTLAVSRIRVAVVAGGRSSEHEISLASARSVLEALDPARYEVTQIAIGRDGRWALEAPTTTAPSNSLLQSTVAETLPVLADSKPAEALAAVDVVLPVLHGPVRRGRHRAGAARAGGHPVRRRRRGRVRALHGQGPVQGGAARPRHPGRAQRDAPARRRDREPVRLPRVRQAGPARLVGRDLEGARRRGARGRRRAGAQARREGARRGVRRRHRGRVRRAGQRAAAAGRVGRRRDRPARRVVRLRGQVRRGRLGHHRPGPDPGRDRRPRPGARRSTPSSRPSAREWPASTSSSARTARWS